MTKKVALFIEDGSEELEFIAPLDIMRRANLEVDLIAANNKDFIISSHNVKIIADKKISDINNILDYDAIVIPGGIPGATNLRDNEKIISFYKEMHASKKLVAAICAAPIVLSTADIINNTTFTCYPGFEEQINSNKYNATQAVVINDNVITAQGPALAMLFGFEIVKYLLDEKTAETISNAMLIPVLKNNLK